MVAHDVDKLLIGFVIGRRGRETNEKTAVDLGKYGDFGGARDCFDGEAHNAESCQKTSHTSC